MGKAQNKLQAQPEARASLITKQAIWTEKERIEAGKPLPDYLTDEQIARLVTIGAAGEEKGE